jgi:prolyl-tRNA synthetase
VQKETVVLARRDKPGKEGKTFVSQAGLSAAVKETLELIQKALYERALNFRNANTVDPKNYEEFQGAVEKGFASSYWCGSAKCEQSIKEATKATLRCIPLEQPDEKGTCIFCGQSANEKVIFAKAY